MTTKSREEKVAELVETSPGLITLSKGAVLRAKRVNSLIFGDLTRKFPRPQPPVVFVPDLGREQANPDDPHYLSSIQAWETEISLAMIDAMILLGTELVSIPDEFDKPEDEAWADDLRAIGFSIGKNPRLRYLMWVKYYAGSDEDVAKISEEVGALSGVSEKDVSDAVQFRRRKS